MFRMALRMLLIVASATSAAAQGESVLLNRVAGAYVVPVQVNSTTNLDFTLDSGAADVSVPADVFAALKRSGTVDKDDLLQSRVYKLADGSEKRIQRFVIRSLRVGRVELRGVVGAVTPEGSPPLLGQSFLSRFTSWSVDNQHHVLLLDDQPPKVAQSSGEADDASPQSHWKLLGQSFMLGPKYPGPWIYVDTTRIQIDGEVRRAWFKSVPPVPPWKNPNVRKDNPHRFDKDDLSLDVFNCRDRRSDMLMSVTEHVDGTRDVMDFSQHLMWSHVVPDSLGEAELLFVCAWSPR